MINLRRLIRVDDLDSRTDFEIGADALLPLVTHFDIVEHTVLL